MAKDPAVSSIEVDCLQRADPRTLSVQVGAPWGIDRIDTNGGPTDDKYDDGNLSGKGVRVYVVDTGVQAHADFGGRVVPGNTVKAARHQSPLAQYAHCPYHTRPSITPTPHSLCPLPANPLPSHFLTLPSSQAFEHPECASCQAINGILPADGTGCEGHGTHVASTVGGLKYGVAKNVTIVPAFSCFKFRCRDGRYECGSSAGISANLECASRHTSAARRRRF